MHPRNRNRWRCSSCGRRVSNANLAGYSGRLTHPAPVQCEECFRRALTRAGAAAGGAPR
jgi:DNA-directed RNA polymerase subunit RPC12/RpoP